MLGCRSGRPAYLVVAEGGVAGVGETLAPRRMARRARSRATALVTHARPPAAFASADELDRDQWPGR